MRTPLALIVRIELIKFLKRKDFVAILGIVCIGFIFALNMRGEGYTGAENQSAVFWVTTQLLTVTSLFIGPIIMAFIGTQMLSSEIDNNSILLFNSRIRNREKMYFGKSIAMVLIGMLFFIVSVGILFVIYLVCTDDSTRYVTGKILGNNTLDLILVMFMNYVYAFFFVPQLTLFLGSKFKPLVSVIFAFGVSLFFGNTGTLPLVKYFNPMYYVVRLANDVASTTEIIHIDVSERVFCVLAQLALCIAVCLVFNLLGAQQLKERDL